MKNRVSMTVIERDNSMGIDNSIVIELLEKESISEGLIRNGIQSNVVCAGRGTCGKCKVKVLEGELEISSWDRNVLRDEEIQKGFRLGCKGYPKKDITIRVEKQEEGEFAIVTDHNQTYNVVRKEGVTSYYIGIDIGTTTIGMQLMEGNSKNIIVTNARINRQRRYGADVISRLQSSNEGRGKELQESIRQDLWEGIIELLSEASVLLEEIQGIGIACNTTMGHLLMGYSCETLGVYPFTPINLKEVTMPLSELLGVGDSKLPVSMLPGISTFVGGDIVAGLLDCEFYQKTKITLIIDLGTNGEMAIGNKDRILVTSTAAGPAFEGGNILWGVGSVPGAISSVRLEDGKITYQTIGNKDPIGICGTGVVEMTAELLRTQLLDETGLLKESYERGYVLAENPSGEPIIFTQKDVREIQLAKAAVRAGLETLIAKYEIGYEEIDAVYLAGGFGYWLDVDKAVEIGMLPRALATKTIVIGNSSLSGALKYLIEPSARDKVQQLVDRAIEVTLANDMLFNKLYIDHMFFDEEEGD